MTEYIDKYFSKKAIINLCIWLIVIQISFVVVTVLNTMIGIAPLQQEDKEFSLAIVYTLLSIGPAALTIIGLTLKVRLLFWIGYSINYCLSLICVFCAFSEAGNVTLVQLGITILCLWFLATILGLGLGLKGYMR
ncbi:hypothetical protein [Fangia hongkongensis]|uniref:hypothetical protein n=1 Tax=Fangia hongkongensis TaxID=270495 RepID=UPI0012B67CAD|nr:hypothetical protein [Fangia hongkongensis]